ncbi:unnamed protein product [Danaus chrysippus]|uniref:(African queen) hypothetical protein n=1 Tax=Danaus chrysippus TaxID=151541 RepID=A0A8J2VYJ6_9NEOP|nr:unnamed protein product [Danaus chrysippus]
MDFKYFIFLLLLNRSSNAEDTEVYKMSDRVFTCSKWLSSVIDNFCNKVFKIVKRDASSLIDKLTPKDLRKHQNKQRWRVRRQVASECCERPCTVGNIIMYCPDDAKLLIEDPDIFD